MAHKRSRRAEMPAPKVFLARCNTYDQKTVDQRIREAFSAFGGVDAVMPSGSRVLVKPNLLMSYHADKAVTTHPAVIEALLKLLLDAGARVTIGDSPGFGSAARVAQKAGIADVAARLGVRIVEFNESVEVTTPPGSLFRKIYVARAALEADAIINVPKFKSHGQMTLTLAVKNLFGCVVGRRKAQWHMAAGRDHHAFARLLLELAGLLAPCFNLIDGIVGMDGNGPSAGRARPMGVLLAGPDALAVDHIAAAIAGISENRLPIEITARQIEHFEASLRQIEVVGAKVQDLALDDFEPPESVDVQFGPRFLRRTLRNALAARPKVDRQQCQACGICADSCPPQAMTLRNTRIEIDHSACISCFCCQEMCPHHAIDTRRGWLARLLIHRST
jgi:uncharacterized protein (DUF362 family)/Pyruvate/2-oxoacid:ferredoxin oxidoreductase delta subunit